MRGAFGETRGQWQHAIHLFERRQSTDRGCGESMEKNDMYLFTDLKMDYPVDLDRKSRNADVLLNMHHHTQMSSEPQEMIK